ncbi:hypothetical protein ACJMK2_041932 [Sinanodonta woodiana]|uniref:Uncharacterized protein n=1 Tax=Sinanodonta woodiana TaxID=1069815 RepID=A0ABD3W5R6_SINWO
MDTELQPEVEQFDYPLHVAVANGNLEAVENLVRTKDINSCDEDGKTPLHVACEKSQLDTLKTLLTLGADVNKVDRENGRTALHYACLTGRTDIVDELLRQGAVVFTNAADEINPLHLASDHIEVIKQLCSVHGEIRCRNKDESEPIHFAALRDRHEILEQMVTLGADINAKDWLDATPMHYAARGGGARAIQKLHELGAPIQPKDYRGNTPLHYAAMHNQDSTIAVLSELGADMHTRDRKKATPLHLAAKLGNPKSVAELLRCRADMNLPIKKGRLAIHIAAANGHVDVIAALHSHGCDLDVPDKKGQRPIHYAVQGKQPNMVKCLVSYGANLDAPDENGRTAVHKAVQERNHELIDALCTCKASPNVEDKEGHYPIYYAAINEDAETGRCLLKYGVQLNRYNKDGMSTVHVLTMEGNEGGLRTIKELHGSLNMFNKEGDTPVHLAVKVQKEDTIRTLMDLGADLNICNRKGLSALHVAILEKKLDQLDLLHKLKADINGKTTLTSPELPMRAIMPPKSTTVDEYITMRGGFTPLHLATMNGDETCIRKLVEFGANIDQTDDVGESALHLAALFDKKDIIPYLMSCGVQQNARDKHGRTPLHYATHTGNREIVKLLLTDPTLVSMEDDSGFQAVHYAAKAGHTQVVADLISHSKVDVNCKDKSGKTPIHIASENGMLETILELAGLKAEIDVKDSDLNTPLHSAAMSGQADSTILLVSLGANVNAQNKIKQTPLHLGSESGSGDVMMYLLICGADPSIKDNNEALAHCWKIKESNRQEVRRRLEMQTSERLRRYKTGEIAFQAKLVNRGKTSNFDNLGIMLDMTTHVNYPPLVIFHRTPIEMETLDIPLSGFDEILSDVYEMHILRLDRPIELNLTIPIDGYPGKFEAFIKTQDGQSFKASNISEENGIPTFIGSMIIRDTAPVQTFVIAAKPKIETLSVASTGGTFASESDQRIRVDIPQDAFKSKVDILMQVLETDNLYENDDRLIQSPVVNIISKREQPSRRVTFRLPLYQTDLGEKHIIVFTTDDDRNIADEDSWGQITDLSINGGCVTFEVPHFSVYVAVSAHPTQNVQTSKKLLVGAIKRALQRETSVVFFTASCLEKKGVVLAIAEATTPGKVDQRISYWRNEGFQFHENIKHSASFPCRPNQVFDIQISGNIQRAIDTGRTMITFNPRSYRFQSFRIIRGERRGPYLGQIDIFRINGNESDLVTSMPMLIPEKGCVIA